LSLLSLEINFYNEEPNEQANLRLLAALTSLKTLSINNCFSQKLETFNFRFVLHLVNLTDLELPTIPEVLDELNTQQYLPNLNKFSFESI